MSVLDIRTLTQERFNAFVDWTRLPSVEIACEELYWYSCKREFVLGVVVRDYTDQDYCAIVLGRDECQRFRCIDLEHSIDALNTARARLKKLMKKHVKTKKEIFPQGDEGHKPVDLFTPVVDEDKMHPQFHRFLKYSHWAPATGILKEMMRHFVDVDGNFVQQFQTTGFDARLWELYLYAYFKEEHMLLDQTHHAPDFVVEKYGKKVCIEATTVNPTGGFNQKIADGQPSAMKDEAEVQELLKDYMPIKFGSALYSKLSKKTPYWELEHVKGNPLVFAIADFHEAQSMVWSHSALWQYLYGVSHEFNHDEDGKLIISPLKIDKHVHGKKEIPSGFFFQENAENVSAVMFSNSGTISKFNRMGKLAGFGGDDIKLMRGGTCHNHDPNASLPNTFYFEVEQGKVKETWAEGLNMFHNPNAINPVPKELFPSIAHHEFVDGQIVSQVPDFYPYSSMTYNFRMVGKDEEIIDFSNDGEVVE